MCCCDLVVSYICNIVSAIASLGAVFIAWAELSDYRSADIKVSFAPPSPELETSTIRKLRLVVENKGRGVARDVEVHSLTPNLLFGFSGTGKHTFRFKSIGSCSEDYINCFDPDGDLLSQEYDIVVKWKGFLCSKCSCTKKIFWSMYANAYPPLPDIQEFSTPIENVLSS